MMKSFEFSARRYKDRDVVVDGDDIRVQKMKALVGRGKRILDVGCLDGVIGEIMVQNENEVFGIDASYEAVQKAKSRGINAFQGDLEDPLPFNDKTFDVVLAGEIVEHIFEIDSMLEELHRVTRSDGYLVLSTPNLAAFGRRVLLLLNRNPHIEISFSGNAASAGHIRYFIKDTLLDILGKHHFEVDELDSDVINLNSAGTLRLTGLATLFPTFGRSLIVKASKQNK